MTRSAGRGPAGLFACASRLVPFCASTAKKSGVVQGLVGRRIPSVVLQECCGSPLDLGEFARSFSLVLYFYPGSPDGEDALGVDGIQHRVFSGCERELSTLGFQAIGVSSQSTRAQREAVLADRVGHRLLSDPGLLLARELGLATFKADGAWWYQRLVLVVTGGRVAHAFSMCDPGRSAGQTIAWILIHSGWPGAGVDAS
jgi:peroxiredoxin